MKGSRRTITTCGVDTLYRYEDHFRDPDTALGHFADVPFLNMVFECLTAPGDWRSILDGFSNEEAPRYRTTSSSAASMKKTSVAYGDTKLRGRRFAAFFIS
jgi:hypothetical protein